ncbi:MAG TPA: phenylalanine--tRNA ligase subunit beta [Candidatus Acidoferrales bacterium]|nr:phenylalanine--tRNA ligase subunit beta [Candidatus Acidoferrales bacterium]
MNVLYEWLKEYAPVEASPEQLRKEMPLVGVTVETARTSDNGASTLLEIDVTPNRPDLLSHYGVAREVAAHYSKPLKPVEPAPKASSTSVSDSGAAVDIASPDLCHRYVALIIRNVKVGPSPDWLAKRLEACGVASINNIVDVTNYVLLELGHPTHAFDLDTLTDKRILVRTAKPGEKITTLDGVARALKPHHLVIADARRPVALAGIMGGAETEISFRTKNVLLESAWFDPITTRRAAKELGLRTEASYRFERGMDVEMPLRAARRCAELFLELAGGELLAGALDVYPRPWQPAVIQLRQTEIERILGMALPREMVERILSALGFKGTRASEASWQVVSPPWRRDVTREVDLIEELARHYGYDKVPAHLPDTRQPVVLQRHTAAEASLRQTLEAQGYDEAVSFTTVSPAAAEPFLAPGDELARLHNPLSEELSVLRPSGLLSLVETLAWNVNRGQRHLLFYEIGKGYALRGRSFSERRVLTLAATGSLREKSVHEAEQPCDLFTLKGAVEAVLERFDLPAPSFSACEAAMFHPAQRVAILCDGQQLGVMGQLSPELSAQFKLRQDAWLAELDLDALYAAGLRPRRFQPLSRFPAVTRDFSLVLENSVSFGAVREAVEALKIAELISVAPVDRFRGGSIPAGRYSLLIRAVFQSAERTLTEEEIRGHSERIVQALEKKLGATLRA